MNNQFVGLLIVSGLSQKDVFEKSCQFTGLLNGEKQEIFEGDILQEKPNGYEPREYFDVFWSDFCWVLRFKNVFGARVNERHFEDAFNMKIVGNIYSNPELLK